MSYQGTHSSRTHLSFISRQTTGKHATSEPPTFSDPGWVPGIGSLPDDIPLAAKKFSYLRLHASLVFAEFYFSTKRFPRLQKKIMTKDYFLIILLQFSHICVGLTVMSFLIMY